MPATTLPHCPHGRPTRDWSGERLHPPCCQPPADDTTTDTKLTATATDAVINALALEIANARDGISSMPIAELSALLDRVVDDTFDQITTILKAMPHARRHDLISSFERIADAWTAAHAARIAIAADAT